MIPNINGFVNRLLRYWTVLTTFQMPLVQAGSGKNKQITYREMSRAPVNNFCCLLFLFLFLVSLFSSKMITGGYTVWSHVRSLSNNLSPAKPSSPHHIIFLHCATKFSLKKAYTFICLDFTFLCPQLRRGHID